MKIRALALDLGNVVLDLNPKLTLEALGREVPMRFSEWPVYMNFESGAITEDEFIDQLRSNFQLSWSEEEIKKAWNLMLPGLLPGIENILENLPEDLPLFALSNTNSFHMRHFESMSGLRHFDRIYSSFELKARKPSQEIFERFLELEKLTPAEVLFVDDLEENVLAARQTGLKAEQCYRSANELSRILKNHGITF